MIDLETLATTPEAAILTIGACKFDPHGDTIADTFYERIDIDTQDRDINPSTIEWWSKQDPSIMEEAFSAKGRMNVETMLDQLTKWLVGVDTIWGHGYGFDISILEDLYRNWNRSDAKWQCLVWSSRVFLSSSITLTTD